MKRRQFLERCGLLAAAGWYGGFSSAASSAFAARDLGNELQADVVILGGGLGGCAAALAATRLGARVVLTEPTDWIGGQLTQQAVPPDEHRWIEDHGCTRSYRQFRQLVRDYYRHYYPLTEEARANPHLNPGAGSVSRLCHEPRVALAVLEGMLAPALSRGQLTLLLNTVPTGAETQGDRVQAVQLLNHNDGRTLLLRGKFFIDATEEGDLLPLTGTEYVTGAEARAETGEAHAAEQAEPHNIQAFTWCFAVDHWEGEDHTIERPAQYDFWRQYVPQLDPPWPGRLLSLVYSNPRTLEPRPLQFVPPTGERPAPRTETLNLWLYRRIIARDNFQPQAYRRDVTLINWPQNDYLLGNLHEVSADERKRHLEGARQLSLSLLYWLQTEAPRPDGGQGWPGLRLRKDLVGTTDGLAKAPYIRESRRIRAEFTVREQHVEPLARMEATGADRASVTAQPFEDSVGVGHYHLDLHPSSGGDNYIDMGCLPFQIPLGALLPRRMENLLAGCKNIGTTHITNGCYRLHPVEWNIGESAGMLAAHCLSSHQLPRQVRAQATRLAQFQQLLTQHGIELQWPG